MGRLPLGYPPSARNCSTRCQGTARKLANRNTTYTSNQGLYAQSKCDTKEVHHQPCAEGGTPRTVVTPPKKAQKVLAVRWNNEGITLGLRFINRLTPHYPNVDDWGQCRHTRCTGCSGSAVQDNGGFVPVAAALCRITKPYHVPS